YVGRLAGTKGTVWQYTAIDVASGFAWAELHTTPRGSDHRQRLRVSLPRARRAPRRARNRAAADPRRQADLERPRRTAPAHDPGGMLATLVCPLARPEAHRPAARPGRLPPLLQLRPRPHRAAHQGPCPGRDRLRCQQDASREM